MDELAKVRSVFSALYGTVYGFSDYTLTHCARRPVRMAFLFIAFGVIVGGGLFSLVEPNASWWDGAYWSVVVMTTVGFGDFSPETIPGRWVFVLVVCIGIISTLMVTAAFAGEIVERRIKRANETVELDDDVDEIIEALGNLKSVLSHPKIVQCLHEIHKEEKRGT